MSDRQESGNDHVSVDELNDLPECRVVAGWDVAGVLRFEMDRERARLLLDQVRERRQQPRDGFVDFVVILDYSAYTSLTKGLAELHSAYHDHGDVASKQVVVTPEQQDVAVSVLVNESQIESSMKKNYAALKQYGDGRAYGQRFSTSENGAVILIQQLEAFLEGADNPLDAVDSDDARFPEVDV